MNGHAGAAADCVVTVVDRYQHISSVHRVVVASLVGVGTGGAVHRHAPCAMLEEKSCRKAMIKMKLAIKENVNSRGLLTANEEELIKTMNSKITGWRNYDQTKIDGKLMQVLDWYIICTFTRWYNKKHQRRNYLSQVGKVKTNIYVCERCLHDITL